MKGVKEFLAFVWKEFSLQWWWLGAVIASFSVISFIQKVFTVGLAPFPKLMLDYYRAATAPLRDVLHWLFKLPDWHVDLAILSLIFLTVSVRAESWPSNPSPPIEPRESKAERISIALIGILLIPFLVIAFSVGLMGLLIPFFQLFWWLGFRDEYQEAQQLVSRKSWDGIPKAKLTDALIAYSHVESAKKFAGGLLIMAGTSVAFFVWNFQAN